jgi:Ca2+-binding RTX toxin-like protein
MANQNPTGSATALLADGKQNTAYLLTEATLLQGFTDPEQDTLAVLSLLADTGELAELGSGQWRFTPDSKFSGAVQFDYFVMDGNGGATPASLMVNILATPTQVPPTGKVTITGSALQYQTLTASHTLVDANGLGTVSYQWLSDGVAMVGATDTSYTLTQADVGKFISVKASYVDGWNQPESVTSDSVSAGNVNDSPTGQVTIDNPSPQVGQVLAAANTLADVDGLGTMSYTWKMGNTVLATGDKYTVTTNALGKVISVTASYTDALGMKESVSSAATAPVIPAPVVIEPGFVITKDDLFTSEAGDTANIGVALATKPTRDVLVTFASSDLTEGRISNPILTFTADNWASVQMLKVVGVNDNLYDHNQIYTITNTISSNDVVYRNLFIDPIAITNQEDLTTVDEPPIPIGTPLDRPLKIIGDALLDTRVVNASTGLFKRLGDNVQSDVLHGLDGDDTLSGGDLQDDLSGGIGNDYLIGGEDEDFLYGQLGNDTLYGSYGKDKLYGDDDKNSHGVLDGNDYLWGEQDDDYLSGGGGKDSLDGGLGLDTMVGGAGNDTYYLGYDALDVITDNGLPSDVDTVIMPYNLDEYTLPLGIENGSITPGTAASKLTGNDSNNNLNGNEGKNVLSGGKGNDSLAGGAGDDTVNGGEGNDEIIGGNGLGDDDYVGGTGTDTVKYTSATVAITVDLGQGFASGKEIGQDKLLGIEHVTGGQAGDSLTGSAGNNFLDGYTGNDTLIGGLGKDTLHGGLGADQFKYTVETETGITATTRDTIDDFKSSQGDKLDLSGIDSDSVLAGNNLFSLPTVGGTFSGVFSNRGELYFDKTAHVLYGNTDTDGTAEFPILLTGVNSLGAGDLLL